MPKILTMVLLLPLIPTMFLIPIKNYPLKIVEIRGVTRIIGRMLTDLVVLHSQKEKLSGRVHKVV